MADERPQYQHGIGTIGGSQFHWGSGTPGKYWSVPYGDYPVTPDAPTGAWAHQVGAIPIANNVIPDSLLGRNRIGIMIHSGSSDSLDQLYTQGCFKVAPEEWPAVRSEILKEAANGPLYLHVQPGGVASFTNTKTMEQTSIPTASNSMASPLVTTTAAANGLSRPVTPTPGPTLFTGVNPDARGMRNNNPGNLIDNDWTRSLPGYKGSDGKFAIFDTPENGAMALDRNLQHYGSTGFDTPLSIASHWAPAQDNNNPNSYGEQIAKALGTGLNDKIDMSDQATRSKITNAIAMVENGPGQFGGLKTTQSMFANAPSSAAPTAVASNAPASGPPTSVGDALKRLTQKGEDDKPSALSNLAEAIQPTKQQQQQQPAAPQMLQAPQADTMLAPAAQQLLAQTMAASAKPLSWSSSPYGSGTAGQQPPGLTLNGNPYG